MSFPVANRKTLFSYEFVNDNISNAIVMQQDINSPIIVIEKINTEGSASYVIK